MTSTGDPNRLWTARPRTYAEFVTQATAVRLPADWRAGQLWFNLLVEARPDLADRVRGTPLDPFHRDDRLPAFLAFLAVAWPSPTTDGAPGPVTTGDLYLAAYAELHELVRRFLAGEANARTLRRRLGEVEWDLRVALDNLRDFPTLGAAAELRDALEQLRRGEVTDA